MSDLKRFYFDDGSSRKRWQVRVKGKSQIVEYGRLGASLRESKKSFKTPAEAAEKTEKLIAKKKREGYTEINSSRLEIVRPKGKRKATEQQIKALEKHVGHKLPDEYRNFLKTNNGGRPNPDCVRLHGVKGIENVAVESLLRLQPSKPEYDEITFQLEAWGEDLLQGHVPIAEGGGDCITLSLEPKTFGAVYWWSHETDEPGFLLAGSFDEFLTRIAVVFGDDEEFEEEPTSQSVAVKKKPKATIKRLLRLVNHDHTPEKIEEMEQIIAALGDLSGIEDGQWPFNNIDSPRLIRCLLKAGLNPEIIDKEGHSLLWQCAGDLECVNLLVERGVRIDHRSGSGSDYETALMRAMFVEDIPAVKRLLQLGANPTVRLSWPIKSKLESNAKLRKLVEKARADWQKNGGWKKKAQEAKAKREMLAPEKKKKTPKPTIKRLLQLMTCYRFTDECEEIDELEELITALGDLSGIKDGKWPAIRSLESPRLLHCLLDAGLNPEITDKDRKSLLCQCVVHPECIDLLLEKGADIDRRSGREDVTALMQAIHQGDKECVEWLLDAGADPTLEFISFTETMLSLYGQIDAIIKTARKNWKPTKGKRKKAKKPTVKKKKK